MLSTCLPVYCTFVIYVACRLLSGFTISCWNGEQQQQQQQMQTQQLAVAAASSGSQQWSRQQSSSHFMIPV
jgi:hypothetical protein